jgi:hypothetical protein
MMYDVRGLMYVGSLHSLQIYQELARITQIMTNKETIDRWAESIIPAVFKAEDALQKAKPEWKERLDKLGQPGGEDPHKVAEEYCREIATIIVRHSDDYDTTDYSDHDPVDDL